MKKGIALLMALVLLFGAAAQADSWKVQKDNAPRMKKLVDLLRSAYNGAKNSDTIERLLKKMRAKSEADYEIARAVVDHWKIAALDENYPLYLWNGEETAEELEAAELLFGEKHAFVVLGYRLKNGEMTEELVGRCNAAAAAARSYPEAILVCTGGATGDRNPEKHTEGGLMKDYLVNECGIDEGRIFTETEAMTTEENAVKVIRILQEQGVETFTLVTSDYHQLWSQVVFNAVAAIFRRVTGETISLAGSYSYPARPDAGRRNSLRSGLNQLEPLLKRKIDFGP